MTRSINDSRENRNQERENQKYPLLHYLCNTRLCVAHNNLFATFGTTAQACTILELENPRKNDGNYPLGEIYPHGWPKEGGEGLLKLIEISCPEGNWILRGKPFVRPSAK